MRRIKLILFCGLGLSATAQGSGNEPYSGTAAGVKVEEALKLVDFQADAPGPEAPRELRLLLGQAITLTDLHKQGIKGGGVNEVPVTVRGDLTLTIPIRQGKPDYTDALGELTFLGANRIAFRGPLQEATEESLKVEERRVVGSLRFPMQLKEPKSQEPRNVDLKIYLDLLIEEETFRYTPDSDPSIPPWRASKFKPSGNKVTGRWRTVESLPEQQLELEGSIAGAKGCYKLARTAGSFFPVQGVDLVRVEDGMRVRAFASPKRVDWHDSQWAVKEFKETKDLSKFNGVRLRVKSEGPPPAGRTIPAVALAFRVAGQPWFTCRTVVPLLGGEREHVVDFELFARGSANPGIGAGPNQQEFADLSKLDAIAIGVANPFGVGEVEFTALSLEAVRHRERGSGQPPVGAVTITLDARVKESFAGVEQVPKGLFGYHLANSSNRSKDKTFPWFDAPPISGDGMRLLELTRPGSLRPLDHTSFSGEKGAEKVRILATDYVQRAEALDAVMHTVTNENLWSRPRWMDMDPDLYADGIREMFRHVGRKAWTPDAPENSLRQIEFWNEPFMWARHINRGDSTLSAGPGDPGGNRGRKAWEDPTQFTFMPGKLGAEMYAKFFNAAAEGLEETNPHVKIGGMSSGIFGEDFFSQLTNYVAHFIAASHEQIDFLTEHHYSSRPASTAAAYETVTAWTLAKHGKRWPIWNTEVNDIDDIAPGDQRSPEAAKALTDQNRAYYNYRDILELILKARDKAAGRAIHALWGPGWFRNEGEQLMYLHTSALRGSVFASASSDLAILPVSAWEKGGLAIYLLNDSPFPRQTMLKINNLSPQPRIEATGLRLTDDRARFGAFQSPIKVQQIGKTTEIVLLEPLAPREITKLVIDQVPSPTETLPISQSFSDLVVTDVAPSSPLSGSIRIEPTELSSANKAWLRVVARDVQTNEATIRFAGTTVPLAATTAEGAHHVIVDVPIPVSPSELARAVVGGGLPFVAESDASSDGWTLYSLSLLTVGPVQ